MPRRKAPEDLSADELRRLLIEKRRGARQERLEHFRRTGRVVAVAPELSSEPFDKLSSSAVVDTPEGLAEGEPLSGGRRRFTDRILLGVEILAVVGLIGVLLSGLGMLRDLNLEVASALHPATATPTPLIMAVVLPEGHTPPDAQGNTQPNDAEIPPNLLPIVQSLANLPVPTPGPDQAIRIEIPALTLDAPVVQGDGWDELKKGVAQHIGSANPGEAGNVVLSAHNDVYGELFRNLDKLQPGDQVILYSALKQFVYIVDRTEIVDPTAVEVMASTGTPSVTLISCYPYLVDKQRIVVFARFQN
ncbi:MAG TPA: class D sortase [Anaerolineales bacterium]|nr:class D sortase [Anaerolineales bacterium]